MRRSKIRMSKRQRAWQYMRRNPMFAINDILLILEMSEKSLMVMMRQLEHAGYVRRMNKERVFRKRTYKLLKNTGVICPQWIEKQGRLYDQNVQQMQVRDANTKLPVETDAPGEIKPVDPAEYDKGRILKLLDEGATDLLALSQRSGISASRFGSTIAALKREGAIRQVGSSMGVPVFARSEDETA